MDLLQKVTSFSNKKNLIQKKDSILVALSGGADSVVLLHLLTRLSLKWNLTISAVYLNHQLRKKASKQEEAFCQTLCDSLGVELHLASVDIKALAQKNKTGIEETARNQRYELFETLANEYGYDKVALGHHQNDQVETILFRIIRGTGKTGLKGIPALREMYIRPMLNISKDEILAYVSSKKLSYCEDKTNNQSHYKRNYIRNKLIPLLKTNLNQSVEKAILNLSETVSEEEIFLDSIVAKNIKKIVTSTVGHKFIIEKTQFLKCDRWVKRRILRDLLSKLSSTKTFPTKETIDRIDNAIASSDKALSLPHKTEMVIVGEQIVLFSRKSLRFKQKFNFTETNYLKALDYVVTSKLKKNSSQSLKNNKNNMIGRFDLSKICEPIYIRSVEDGDRFCPLGMHGTKKIGDYLIDKKIARVFRDEIVVMADKNGVFWIIGHQIDERVKIDYNTTRVLEIETKRKK